jgi:hypothetical protein
MRWMHIILLLTLSQFCQAQGKGFGFEYHNLHAFAWNESVRTYNFARPFLDNKQPLLQHGVGFKYYTSSAKEGAAQKGFNIGLSWYQSKVENENYSVALHAGTFSVGYRLLVRELFESSGLLLSVSPEIQGTFIGRWQDEELLWLEMDDEETRLIKLGVGAGINSALHYPIIKSEKSGVFLKLSLLYNPLWWTPGSSSVITQSNAVISNELGTSFSLNFGIDWIWN